MVTREDFKEVEDMKGEVVLSSTLENEFDGTLVKISQREDQIKLFIQLDETEWTIVSYRIAKSLTKASHLYKLFETLKSMGLPEDTEVLVGKKIKWKRFKMAMGFDRHFPQRIYN